MMASNLTLQKYDSVSYNGAMKVTALLPDEIINAVVRETGAKTITRSLVIALQEWLSLQKIKRLSRMRKKKPLQFVDGFNAAKVRELNRTR